LDRGRGLLRFRCCDLDYIDGRNLFKRRLTAHGRSGPMVVCRLSDLWSASILRPPVKRCWASLSKSAANAQM
jgi:hypothetical protein